MGTLFFMYALICTAAQYDSGYGVRPWFLVSVCVNGFALMTTVHYFTYSIVLTDRYLSRNLFFVQRKIIFDDLLEILPPFTPGNKSNKYIFSDGKTVIRISVSDFLRNRVDLFVELQKLAKQYPNKGRPDALQ
jgi:hypothetical protein